MTALDLVVYAGSVLVAASAVVGALWWLIKPRLMDYLEALVGGIGRLENNVSGDEPDSLGRHARVAARGVSELRTDLHDYREDVDRWRALVDEFRERTERRLGSVEGALLALLGPELRRRLAEDLNEDHRREEENG